MFLQVPDRVLAEILFDIKESSEEYGQLQQGDHTVQPDFWRIHETGRDVSPLQTRVHHLPTLYGSPA